MAMLSKAPLIESLPHKPYCTDELGNLFIRGRLSAISRQYLQVNRHNMVTYLVFDIDRAGAALAWSDAHLPPPYWTAKNPRNGHAHICYKLLIPFPTSEAAHLEPIRYAAFYPCEVFGITGDKGGGRPKGCVKEDSDWQSKPWEALGISRRTYYNRKKSGTV